MTIVFFGIVEVVELLFVVGLLLFVVCLMLLFSSGFLLLLLQLRLLESFLPQLLLVYLLSPYDLLFNVHLLQSFTALLRFLLWRNCFYSNCCARGFVGHSSFIKWRRSYIVNILHFIVLWSFLIGCFPAPQIGLSSFFFIEGVFFSFIYFTSFGSYLLYKTFLSLDTKLMIIYLI